MSPDFAALLAFAPPVLDEKTAAAPDTTHDSPVRRLREAKALSDRGDMTGKNKILTELVAADPTGFVVDSPNERYPGLTHTQSNFQIHAHPSVAAQVRSPEPTLMDIIGLDNSIATNQDQQYKLAADQPPRHILVSGHSGAGKTTLAKKLTGATGYPVVHLDDHPLWREWSKSVKNDTLPPRQQARARRDNNRKLVAAAMADAKVPSIIEGSQLLHADPTTLAGHRRILVDPPYEQIVGQRLGRDVTKGKFTPETLGLSQDAWEKERRAKTRLVTGFYRPYVPRWRKDPAVEVVGRTKEGEFVLIKEAIDAPKPDLPYRDRAEMYAIDKDGNVFGGLYDHGGFGVFGGGIDPGEDAAEAAAREFAEESGWSVTNPRVLPFQPHTIDWKPPFTPKQAERAKTYRGSRTHYVVGDLGAKIPNAKIDEVGRKDVRPYALDDAIALAAKEQVTDPVLVEANKRRKAVLEHLKASRTPPQQVKVAHYKKLCSKCDKVIVQCRCTGPAKDIDYGLCKDCGGADGGWNKSAADGGDAPVTVAIDFDGTYARKVEPFDPKKAGAPRKKILRLARLLKRKGCRIIVWTVRGDTALVRRWAKRYGAPCDHVNTNPDQPPDSSGKIYADVYLDDKAVNAEDADAAVRDVLDRVGPLLAAREESHA